MFRFAKIVRRAPQNAFSLNAALLCVAVPYTLRQKHYQIWCNDPILLSDKWLVCWAIFLPFCFISKLVMGRTPFYRTSIELEHHFLNIERTWLCSSIGNRTRTRYFGLRMNKHRTSTLIGLSLDLQNYSST